jgi:prolyl 4-hydroxylase
MSQTITPELRQWIIEQATAGFAPEAVLEAMKTAGWDESVALEALESTLREHLRALSAGQVVRPLPPGAARAGGGSRAGAVPDIDLAGSPREIDLGDRRVRVLASLVLPRVVVLGGLLSDEECEALIELARPRLARSRTVHTATGGEELNPDRTSHGMFFNRGENALVSAIEARIARLVNWPVTHGEGLQVLRYGRGAEYKPHYDYFDPAEPGTPTIIQRGGQRVGTLVMYLNEPERGGGTTFPDAGLEVAPQRGHAVFFNYPQPHPSTRTLHGGAPVLAGEKWVATKWLRQRAFA